MSFCLAPARIRGTGTWSLQRCAPAAMTSSPPDLPADDDSAGLGAYTEAVVSVAR